MMRMSRDAVLDAIVMVVASDGEVTEREMDLARAAARDLPSLAPLGADLDRALGEAFERFVDEGTAMRLAAMSGASPSDRIEALLASVVAAAVDGPPTEDEIACVKRIGAALGATPDEITGVLERNESR
jgi:tellurite resistance protein